MRAYGAELVVETARIWIGLGHFETGRFEGGQDSAKPGRRFCIHTVTGSRRIHRARQQQPLHQRDGEDAPATSPPMIVRLA